MIYKSPMPFARVAVVLLSQACLVTCTTLTDPPFPAGAVPMQAPRPYRMWWQLTESCSGRQGAFKDVQWYYVPGARSISVDGNEYQGYWYSLTNRIVLAGHDVLAGKLVRHEMLHALVGGGHDRRYFVDACGGFVVCEDNCLAEAGGPVRPDSGAPVIPIRDVSVQLQINPDSPSVATDSGWIAVSVSVNNPSTKPVWLSLDTLPGNPYAAATFGFALHSLTSCDWADDYQFVWDRRMAVGPGLTRVVFDRLLRPGRYSVYGCLNGNTTAPAVVQVGP